MDCCSCTEIITIAFHIRRLTPIFCPWFIPTAALIPPIFHKKPDFYLPYLTFTGIMFYLRPQNTLEYT
jgi:hypothetical protein